MSRRRAVREPGMPLELLSESLQYQPVRTSRREHSAEMRILLSSIRAPTILTARSRLRFPHRSKYVALTSICGRYGPQRSAGVSLLRSHSIRATTTSGFADVGRMVLMAVPFNLHSPRLRFNSV